MFSSFFKLLVRCYQLALPYGRRKLAIVLGVILSNGLMQLVGVTSVFPFFALCAEPDRIRNSRIGSFFTPYLNSFSTKQLLVAAGILSIAMLLIASVSSMLSEVVRIRYAFGFGQWLRSRVFESYAERPYGFFLTHNPAELSQKLGDTMTFVQSVLLPLGECITRLVLIVLLVGTVVFVQPYVALGGIVILGGFYYIAFILLRPRTKKVADMCNYHGIESWKNTGQFIHGIKTVLVHGKEGYFIKQALDHSAKVGAYQAKIPIYSNGPRYMIEPIAFGGLVSVVLVLAIRGRPFSDILPNLSVIALAAYRLLPALQLLYSQLVTIAANAYTLQKLEDEILRLEMTTVQQSAKNKAAYLENPLTFLKQIKLSNITFQYPAAVLPTFSDFSLTILKDESLGIAGASGSGKSTLVDIILGLHTLNEGEISVDGVVLNNENIASWRRMIGYVSQEIYLLDDSIEANIAFGIDPKEIDANALKKAAEGAQILDLIEKELPEGFKSTVGDRGVRLSGGQRQRIGLARALYHRPQVLILDEATSALDHETEAAVMETIYKLQGSLTIITIAHRLTTLERCDRIIKLEKGIIIE